jgi:PIN domain nuclease of toxin-antitoxin system
MGGAWSTSLSRIAGPKPIVNLAMAEIVLDSSAVIAMLSGENGGVEVRPLIPRSLLSIVNLSEIAARLTQDGRSPQAVQAALDGFSWTISAFDKHQAMAAGLLRPATRRAGLSLGDRACLALALIHGLPVLTADRAWAKVDVGVEVRLIR